MKESTIKELQQAVLRLEMVASRIRTETAEVSATNDHIEIIRHYDRLRLANASIKTARAALSEIEDNLSKVRIPEVMRYKGVKTIHIEDVGRVTVSGRFTCSMLDQEAGINWLTDNGHGGIIKPTVHWQTLSSFAKEYMEESGRDLPDDIFKISMSEYTSIRKV